ncbi:lipid asymmetry maintenance protein MlaB [Steroidobacter sp.]|uniref:STAS domain-containing protein n=1 Tax=Steroidobacter sp. TaxID=1978227 RepID=UPI001A4AF5E5|nr:STAS domain-containing protein [Steroidobacter sp.]MBL8265858.1 STAS domain-containing protein [Steroidobacter sp.]
MNARPATTPGPAKLEALGNGRFKVYGALNAETVTDLLKRSEAEFRGAAALDIDLANVPEGDSAGLALLIEWLRLAQQNKQTIHFNNVPAQIAALARISEVEKLLNCNGNGAQH